MIKINKLAPWTEKRKPGNKLLWHSDGTIYEGSRTMKHIGILFHFKLDPKDIIAYAMIGEDGIIPWDWNADRLTVRRKDWIKLLQLLRRAEPKSIEEVIKIGVERGWHNAVRLVEESERRKANGF